MAPKFPWSKRKSKSKGTEASSSDNTSSGQAASDSHLTNDLRNLDINDPSSFSQTVSTDVSATSLAEDNTQPGDSDPPPAYQESPSSQPAPASTPETPQPESSPPVVLATSPGLLEKGIDIVRKAIDADNAGSYPTAYALYTDALQYFILALKKEQNPQSQELIRKKAEEYMERAESIQAYLSSRAGLPSSSMGRGDGGSAGLPEAVTTQTGNLKNTYNTIQPFDKTPATVNWSDLGGRAQIQKDLLNAVLLPARFPQLFTGPRKPTTRILLYGPPGNGKRTLVKALSVEAKRTLLRVNASYLNQHDLKGAATMISELLTTARDCAEPSIVQMDDFHILSNEIGRFILQELEGKSNNHNTGSSKAVNQVILVGITTQPWDLESKANNTLGIFQEVINVPMPDEASRQDIFAKQIDQIRSGSDVTKSISTDENLHLPESHNRLARLTEGFSVRDIVDGVVKVALMGPVTKIQMASHWKKIVMNDREHLTPCSPGDIGAEPRDWTTIPSDQLLEPPLGVNDFIKAMKECKPSVPEEVVKQFEKWKKG
ncbi:P-loop containing nucleoside triphosphate hydrolase protein [Rhypophila decipiens]|uniref:vesicle-fusing ATPase n=1 Tax=Rhypophila decipiens TaxID=261697 RepID=A0AAN7B5J6_9PEZI|nr:P-loop containing nucleoside triphosphate hydrolase protein [Rhypophila decipiens]